MLPIVIKLLLAIHVLVSLLIILLVLMQRPKNEGLGAAFGGGMTENLFGAQTSNVLQTITRWLGGTFFGLSLVLSFLYVKNTHNNLKSSIQQKLSSAPAVPVAPTTPNASEQDKVRDAIMKAVEDAKAAAPAEGAPATPATPEAATPPVKPGDAAPATPADPAAKPATPEAPAGEAPK